MSTSSYYNAKLEKERRDKLAKDVERRIREAENRINTYRIKKNRIENKVYQEQKKINIMPSDLLNSRKKYKASEISFNPDMFKNSEGSDRNSRSDNSRIHNLQKMRTKEIMDSSPINKLIQEVSDIIENLNISLEWQKKEKDLFVSFFNEIISDKSLSNDDRREIVFTRLKVLKRKFAFQEKKSDETAAKQLRLEALKQLLGIEEGFYGTIDEQISKLQQRLTKREENNLIMEELSDVMKELGYQVEGGIVIENENMTLWDSDMAWCDLAVKGKNQVFIIDTVVRGEEKALTDNQMKEVEEEARDVCRQKKLIASEMLKRGIKFDLIADSSPEREHLKYSNYKSENRKKHRTEEKKIMSLN